jgi:hypothetical protein
MNQKPILLKGQSNMKLKNKGHLLLVSSAQFAMSDNVELFEDLLDKQTARLSDHYESMMESEQRIRQDKNLSDLGRKKQLADLYGRHLEFMRSIADDSEVRSLNARKEIAANRLREALRPEVEKMDSARAEIRAQEIRRWFETVDPVMREQTYLDAVSRGDVEICRAIEDAPSFYGFLSESLIHEGQRRRQAKLNPDDSAFVSDVRTLDNAVRANIARTEKELEPLRKVAFEVYPEVYDPLYQAARGERTVL